MTTDRIDLDALVDWYRHLSPDTLARLPEFYTGDAWFRDPFQEFRSRDRLRRVYEHMFATLEAPRFDILDVLRDGQRALLVWDMHFALRGRPMRIHGTTLFTFAPDGRVQAHHDYWDAAGELYEKLPVLGWLLKRVKNKLQVEG